MSEKSTARAQCPWCIAPLNAKAYVCHQCGAVRIGVALSPVQVFFVHPVIALALMLVGLVIGLPVIKAAGIFVVTWLVLSLIHVALRKRPRWVQLEPLLLKEGEKEPQLMHHMPGSWRPWFATVGIVAVGLAGVLAASPRPPVEPSAAVNVSLDAASTPTASSFGFSSASAAQAEDVTPKSPMNLNAAPASNTAARPAIMASAATSNAVATTTVAPGAWTPLSAAGATSAPTSAPLTETAAATPSPDLQSPPAKELSPSEKSLLLSTQHLLGQLGYSVGSDSTKAEAATIASVRTFRERMGLGGEAIDKRLLAALEVAVLAQQSQGSAQAEARTPPQAAAKPQRPEARPVVETRQPQPAQQAETRAPQSDVVRPRYETRPQRPESRATQQAETRRPQYEARPAQQQAEASIVVAPSNGPAPIHTLVPVINASSTSMPVIVNPPVLPPPPPFQAPVRLGPPIRY